MDIYNSVVDKERSYTWDIVLSLGRQYSLAKDYCFQNIVRYPIFFYTKSDFVYKAFGMIDQWIPYYIYDVVLKLTGQKQR